MKIGCLLEGMF